VHVTSKLVSREISVVSIFIQFVCPVFQFDVKVFLGIGGLAPMHI